MRRRTAREKRLSRASLGARGANGGVKRGGGAVAQRVWAYALSFAAGAVTCMVVERLIPESRRSQNHDLAMLDALPGSW